MKKLWATALAALALVGIMAVSASSDEVTVGEGGNYTDLTTAIAAVSEGTTITLINDITLTEGVVVPTDKAITIDGDGHKLTYTTAIYGAFKSESTVHVASGTDLTLVDIHFVKDNGTAAGTAVCTNENVDNVSITLDGCTLENLYTGVYVGHVEETEMTNSISITDCTYLDTTYGYSIDEVTTGSIVDGVNVTFDNNTGVETVSEPWSNIVLDNGDYKKAYSTLYSAVYAATNGGTVTLNKNVSSSLSLPSAPVTIDLNGYTWTATSAVSINTADKDLTVKNGNISANYSSAVLAVTKQGKLTLDGVKLTNTGNGAPVYITGAISGVDVIDSTITGKYYAIGTNATDGDRNDIVVNVKNSTLETTAVYGVPLLINIPSTVTVEDTIITTRTTGIMMRGGEGTFTNVTVKVAEDFSDAGNSNVQKYFDENWGTGTYIPSAAIVVGNRTAGTSYRYSTDVSFENVTISVHEDVSDEETARSNQLYLYGYYGDGITDYSATATIGAGCDFGKITQGGGYTNVILNDDYTTDTMTIPADSTFVVGEDATLTVTDALSVEGSLTNDGTIVVSDAVALQTALRAGGTVKLGKDITVESGNVVENQGVIEINKDITLDGQGYTLTAEDTSSNKVGFNFINITDGAQVTLENMEIVNKAGNTYIKNGVNVYSANGNMSNVDMNSVTVTDFKCNVMVNNSTATLEDCTLADGTWGYDISVAVGQNITANDLRMLTLVGANDIGVILAGTDYVDLDDSTTTYYPVASGSGTVYAYIPTVTGFEVDGIYFATITDAMEAAADGDTILVSEDVTEEIRITKSLTLKAVGNVTLAGGVYVRAATTTEDIDGVVIDGFTIGDKNTSKRNVNVEAHETNTISNVTISNNTIYGGIFANNTAGTVTRNSVVNLTISGNTIDNQSITNVSGINAWNCENALITGNTIIQGYFNGINFMNSTGRITNNTIVDYCEQEGGEGALKFSGNTDVVVTGNDIAVVAGKNAVYAMNGTYVDVSNNNFNTTDPTSYVEAGSTVIFGELSTEAPTEADKVEASMGSVADLTTETASENQTVINNVATEVTTVVAATTDAHMDTTIVEAVNTLDALFVAANDNLTSTPATPTVTTTAIDDSKAVEVSGLALSVFGGTTVTEGTAVSIAVEQTTGDDITADVDVTADTIVLSIKPMVNVDNAGATVIDNSNLQTPVTFTIYLTDDFAGTYADVVHIKSDDSTESMRLKVYTDDDGHKYITMTVAEFSNFLITPYTYTSGSSTSTYTSSVASTSNGDVSISSSKSASGTKITITTDPNNGYEVGTVTVAYSSGREVTVTDNGDGTYSYIQPGAAVTVTVTFVSEDGEESETETNTFTDVDVNAYYYDAVLWAVDNGITAGYADDTFRPTDSCTRAQAVTFLWRAAGEPEATIDNPFSDLDETAYYYNAVLWAVENDITTGYEDGTFRPNTTCNRGAIVTFLYRASGEPTASGTAMSDVAVDSYCYDAVLWAVSEGITTGYSDGTFQPNTVCNRGAIVTFLYRYMG
ncbi:S-layer homology domain-containing protein [Bengtsoniella intestinalis]|uniref:S-layer homology domain-containing protein n=1 Tax=Bengtsoniella intestinalis TaxID=3073143 RepID=UPI00391F4325